MKNHRIAESLKITAAQQVKERSYWREKLSGNLVKHHLPYDYKKASGDLTNRPELTSMKFTLDGECAAHLKKLSNNSDIRLHMILVAGVVALLYKYTGSIDIIVGMPIYKQEAEKDYINTILPLRNRFDDKTTFRELLNEVRQTIIEASENQDYPMEVLLEELDMPFQGNDFPLFDIQIMTENIHSKEYTRHIQTNISFSFQQSVEGIEGELEFQPLLYRETTIERMIGHLKHLLEAALPDLGLPLSRVEILPQEEKAQILRNFNDTAVAYPKDKTIVELFVEEAEKRPHQIAAGEYSDLTAVYDELDREKETHGQHLHQLEKCCFKRNPYVFRFEDNVFLKTLNFFNQSEIEELILMRTHRDNYVAINRATLMLLDSLEGRANLKSISRALEHKGYEFWVYPLVIDWETTGRVSMEKKTFVVKERFEELVLLIKALYGSNLIELADYHSQEVPLDISPVKRIMPSSAGVPEVRAAAAGSVLLLGDRTGNASNGLLYIASFLKRHGINAHCRWNDLDKTLPLLKANVQRFLSTFEPTIVGVSMKWFPHIARVLEICKTVKHYNPSIKVVVGGNTASYYKEKIIQYEWVDYVVLGDGEVPFLKICKGEEHIPNCVCKKDGKIVETPITYVQNETNSADIYLSHLDEIFVSPLDPYLTPSFYINTGKGCLQQCFYCAGSREAQKQVFNREKPFLRGINEVRRDLIEAGKYTSRFMFDFDLPQYDSLDYYKKIWQGIDLSKHFCRFYFWMLPSVEFIDLVVKTFKYVYINIDLCSLSEKHRLKLSSLKVVKPQPTDAQLLEFFDKCEKYDNVEVIINHITGLPYFSLEDIEKSRDMLSYLVKKYSCFTDMDWGRLHAQPGAPILETCEKYGMHSYGKTYEDFLHYSELNLKEELYPDLFTFNYPYIYYDDETLNAKVTQYYAEATKLLDDHMEKRRRNLSVIFNINYEVLNKKSNQLAVLLKQRGVPAGAVVGLWVDRSLEMIIGLLGILKAGAAYLPLDSRYPPERMNYMLKDSNACMLLTQGDIVDIIGFDGETLDITDESLNSGHSPRLEKIITPGSLAYILYTSGSTGRPKGVMVENENVVRLVKNANFLRFQPGDKLLLTGAIVFDITTFEIWGPLLNGGTLFLADQNLLLDGEKIGEILSENNISILHLIPQLFNQMAHLHPGIFAGLNLLLVGGDLVNPYYVNKIRRLYPDLRILHMYGPTENTTFSTFFRVEKEYENAIPIGKPISNSNVYVINKHNQLLPVGVTGELLVGGDGVARGYLNNPELTALKFDQDLWDYRDYQEDNQKFLRGGSRCFTGAVFSKSAPPGRRRQKLYRTGDLASWLPDGNIEFVGRQDSQVKIRGMRIELGEIERHLLNRQEIKDAVVIAREEQPPEQAGKEHIPRETGNGKYLCAYIVADKTVNLSQLKGYLSQQLPDYMIPKHFIQIDEIPLAVNGKVDKRALTLPQSGYIRDVDPAVVSALLTEKEKGEQIEISGDRFPVGDKQKTEKTIAYFTSLLQENFFNKEIKISGIDIEVPAGENKKQQLPEWAVIEAGTIRELFEKQVEKTPGNTAVWCEGKRLTYKELNAKSNAAAELLRSKGVMSGIMVGIMMDPSPELAAAVLGVIKAGGAYIIINPGLSTESILSLLEDRDVSILLTHTNAAAKHKYTDLLGLKFHIDPAARTSPRPQVTDLDSLVFPHRSEVNYEKYRPYIAEAMVKNSISLQGTRGCPYQCAYCQKIWPGKHVFRSAEHIFEEVKLYYDMGVRRFSFIDDIFNLNVKNSSRFYRLLIENGLRVQLHFPTGVRGDILTEEYIDLMVEAGTVCINIALETASPRLQRLMRKNLDVGKVHRNVHYFCEKYPEVLIGLFCMFGIPSETEQEALTTLNFMKDIQWLHFGYMTILKIYPGTDMEKIALEKGISQEVIYKCSKLAFHELPDTLPFSKNFVIRCQADFLDNYFLSKERLLFALPYQMKVLTEDEIVMKYNSYLPVDIKDFDDLLQFVGITKDELTVKQCLDRDCMVVPDLNKKMRNRFPKRESAKGALKVLLLDLSQFFSRDRFQTDDLVEPPLGLMYVMTHLKEKLGDKINGKIAKAMIDFDSYQELKQLLEKFKPDVIGIRTLNFYADFFHQTAAMIRHWGINAPIIAGGPYATSSYQLLLQDQLIALAVLGEGEITFHQLIGKILENGGRLPGEEVLKEIPGLAFVAKEAGVTRWQSREILLLDQLAEVLSRDSGENLTRENRSTEPAHMVSNPSPRINQDGDNIEKTDLVASFMFDASVHQLFGPLLQGGGVYIVPGAMGLKGINALEFYQERTAGQQGPSLHIRVQLESDLLTGLPSSKGEKYIAPRNEIEEKLTKIWAEVLNMDEAFIGVNDNFFELGGHSLNIVQVKNLLKERLERTIPIARIFAYPTIDSFSRYLQEEETDDIASDVKIKESVDLMEETMQLLIGEDNE